LTAFEQPVHEEQLTCIQGIQDRATNNNNNEKLILIDNQNYTVSKRLWAFAQFRIVRPGAIRIGASGGSNLKSGAFQNLDGSIAVVVINSGTSAQTVSVTVSGSSLKNQTVRAWFTDNTNDMRETVVSVSDGVASASLSGRGMISFLVAPAGGNGTVV
jgi:O-glycosyl hydrolase